jgi:hypothetical protein
MCGIHEQLTFKSPGAQVSELSVVSHRSPGRNGELADWLGLAEPLPQKKSRDKGNLHWTRAWHWARLGHWLINQKKP